MTTRKLPISSRLAVAIGAIVLAGLFSLAFGFWAAENFGYEAWRAFALENFELVSGLPMAAALAFGVVIAFQETSKDALTFKLGPLEIAGPAGPILLWVVCFLAIVFAIVLLSDRAGASG